jgi:hypothetical protein
VCWPISGKRVGPSLKYKSVPHNRLLVSLLHGIGHRIARFGNPDFCGDGPMPDLTRSPAVTIRIYPAR